MKYIAIAGTTASGKTALAIRLAKKFNLPIINSDSRVFYKEFDIGTDKPKKDKYKRSYIVKGVKHYLIDFLNPSKKYSVADFKKNVEKIILDLNKRNIVPIVVGGSMLYLDSLIYSYNFSEDKTNLKKREELSKRSLDDLLKILKLNSPKSYKIVDRKNRRRVLRAVELSLEGKDVLRNNNKILENVLYLGIKKDKEKVNYSINKRVDLMVKIGLFAEVKRLLGKYSKNLQPFSAIGYKEVVEFLENKINKEEAIEKIKINTRRFAKRQLTWYKKDKNINWITNYKEAEKLVSKFIF